MAGIALDFGDEFLQHSTKASGSGFLAKWKEDGRIVVWMHPNTPVISLWSHNFSRYLKVEDKETKEEKTIITGMRINCMEKEKLLKKQTWRLDSDEREIPPITCPHCLLIEHVRSEINAGRMDWTTPLFRFETDEDEDIVYAGGFCGLFQKRDLSKKEAGEIRKLGVKINEAYMQNGMCRQQYVMAVTAESDLEAGWVIAMEGQTLGNKMKKAIADEIKRCDGDVQLGHPRFNPYPFEFNYDENKEFSDKYDVVALSRKRPSSEVQQLLDNGEAPSFDKIRSDPSLGTLKQLMKDAAQVKLPLDDIFARAIDEIGEHFDNDNDSDEEEDSESVPNVGSSKQEKDEAEDDDESVDQETVDDEDDHEDDHEDDGDEDGGCDVCDAAMGPEDMVCGECGAKYEADDNGDVYLASRKCGNEDCMEREVPVNDEGGGVCPQCGAVHAEDWSYKLPKPKRGAKKTTKKASRRTAKKEENKPKHDDARPSRRSRARAALSKE